MSASGAWWIFLAIGAERTCEAKKLTMSSMNGPTPSSYNSANLTELVRKIVPPLTPAAHKGQAGRIGIIGGSIEYTGAPYYAAMTTLKMGGDLAHVFSMREAALAIKAYSPDLIVHPVLDYNDPIAEMEEFLPRLHVLVLGPGLSRRPQVFATLGHIIEIAKDRSTPMVFDADALFYLNENFDVIQGYEQAILTPNRMEFARLYRMVMKQDIRSDDVNSTHVKELAQRLGVTILCKGPSDIITNGEVLITCDVPGSLRRCGGQGDILSGAAGLFLYWAYATQNPMPLPPTVLAAWASCALTRKSAALAFAKHSRGTITSDILSLVSQAFADIFIKSK